MDAPNTLLDVDSGSAYQPRFPGWLVPVAEDKRSCPPRPRKMPYLAVEGLFPPLRPLQSADAFPNRAMCNPWRENTASWSQGSENIASVPRKPASAPTLGSFVPLLVSSLLSAAAQSRLHRTGRRGRAFRQSPWRGAASTESEPYDLPRPDNA